MLKGNISVLIVLVVIGGALKSGAFPIIIFLYQIDEDVTTLTGHYIIGNTSNKSLANEDDSCWRCPCASEQFLFSPQTITGGCYFPRILLLVVAFAMYNTTIII